MKLVALLLLAALGGCATPVTSRHWQACEAACSDREGVKEACVEMFRGSGCHCNNDEILWLNAK